MLVTLLSTIDNNVPVPPLSSMGIGTLAVPLFLWTETDRAPICKNEADLNGRPVLWRLLCMMNHHPSYTFALDSSPSLLLADHLVDSIHTRVLQDIKNELPSNYGATNAFCYTQAKWNCDHLTTISDATACTAGLIQAYNTSSCEEVILNEQRIPEWLDPCGYPDHFRLENPVEVTLDELNRIGGGYNGGFLKYLQGIQEQITQAAVFISTPIDFIGSGIWNDIVVSSTTGGSDYLPIVRVWPLIDFIMTQDTTAASGAFNLSNWLKTQICQNTFNPTTICSNQYATTPSDPCLFPWISQTADIERYLQPSSPLSSISSSETYEPVVTLFYGGGGFDVVNICNLPEGGDSCVLQHLVCQILEYFYFYF